MKTKIRPRYSGAGWLALAALALSLSPGPAAKAGMTDPETGQTCWGAGCLDLDDVPAATGGTGATPIHLPANVSTENCPGADAARIGFTVAWLQDNLELIDAKMRQSEYLAFWPGNSREHFAAKLEKNIEFVCINQKNKCDDLLGVTTPVFAQKRVSLCTTNINESGGSDPVATDALYIHVIAHEIGHLVRINTHPGGCVRRFTDGSFSDVLGFAAEYAFRNEPYDPKAYAAKCAGLDLQAFNWTDKLDQMDKPLRARK